MSQDAARWSIWSGSEVVAVTSERGLPNAENARLIAAAPDLFEACGEMVTAIEGYAQSLADETDGRPGTPVQAAVGTCLVALSRGRAALHRVEAPAKEGTE